VSSERLCWWGKLWHRSIPLAYPLKDSQTGIVVPACRVELIAKKPDLLLRRFDRDGARRIPFLSPMSMLGSKDDETRLSPAYGLNRVPTDIKRRILSAAINEDDNSASLGLPLDVAGYFELDAAQAREIAAQVGKAVSKWRDESARHGLSNGEMRIRSWRTHSRRRISWIYSRR
jgi:serine/threonine-protein kinase HipA